MLEWKEINQYEEKDQSKRMNDHLRWGSEAAGRAERAQLTSRAVGFRSYVYYKQWLPTFRFNSLSEFIFRFHTA